MRVFARIPIDVDEVSVPKGQVHIIPERCKGCSFCVEFCPKQILRISLLTNGKGYHYPEIAPDEQGSCVNCGFCTVICPEFAIFSTEVEA